MGKVVTSQGLTEFIQSGKVTQVPDHKPKGTGAAPALETVKAPVTIDISPPGTREEGKNPDQTAEKSSDSAEKPADTENEGLDAEELTFPERVRKAIGKKHGQMKAAEVLAAKRAEEVAEAERFAEQQYNERRLAEKRADEAEAKNRDLEAKVAQSKPPEPELKEPDENDPQFRNEQGQFDWKKFSKAQAQYEATQAVRAERAKQAEERAAAEQKAHEQRLKASANQARKQHPDFDQVMASVRDTEADRVPQFVLNYVFESDQSAEVAYYLAKHPEETQRIAKLSPIKGLAALGKLEDSLTKSQIPPKVEPAATPVRSEHSGVPAPITPLTGEGTAGVNTDPSKMSFKELREYERARAKKH